MQVALGELHQPEEIGREEDAGLGAQPRHEPLAPPGIVRREQDDALLRGALLRGAADPAHGHRHLFREDGLREGGRQPFDQRVGRARAERVLGRVAERTADEESEPDGFGGRRAHPRVLERTLEDPRRLLPHRQLR